MSAARLRQAAALLQERAEVETILRDGDPYYEVTYMPDGTPITEMGAFERVLTPGVALALAAWLDVAGADEWAHGPHCLTPCDDCDDDPRASHIRSALAVADAILGGDDA